MRKAFFQKLEKIAKENKDIFLLVGDLGRKFFQNFKGLDPKRFINTGVAEANMIGVAAGLSMSGKNVYCYSIIPFLLMRTFEQIRIDVCYNKLNVKLLGAGSGFTYGLEGITHHAIEDIAILRVLPYMTIVAPGDAREAEALAEASFNYQSPLYIRFGRDRESVVHEKEIKFEIGKGIFVNEGKDICLLATGTMLQTGKIVLKNLISRGLNPTLISLHTIKPLDENLIRNCSQNYKSIFTLEEHSIIGGLGSAVAEILAENNFSGKFKRIGIKDVYSPYIGGPEYLLKKLGLDPESITNFILKEI